MGNVFGQNTIDPWHSSYFMQLCTTLKASLKFSDSATIWKFKQVLIWIAFLAIIRIIAVVWILFTAEISVYYIWVISYPIKKDAINNKSVRNTKGYLTVVAIPAVFNSPDCWWPSLGKLAWLRETHQLSGPHLFIMILKYAAMWYLEKSNKTAQQKYRRTARICASRVTTEIQPLKLQQNDEISYMLTCSQREQIILVWQAWSIV
jgi:hypothetical protein